MSNVSRVRRFKAKCKARGLVQLNVWVPRQRVTALQQVAKLLCRRPRYTVDRVVDEVTGRIVGLS